MTNTMPIKKFYIPSFARRRKRGLTGSQKRLMNEVLPAYQLRVDTPETISKPLHDFDKIALEIGFGKGEHLCHRAEHDPKILYIGCEIFDDGIAGCVREMDTKNLQNIRIFIQDARLLIEALPDACLDVVYILFPDPWPKRKEKKRRIVRQETLDLLARVLKKDGYLQLATDHEDYLNWMCVHMDQHTDFTLTATQQSDWLEPPEGHITTRYQHKAKAGRPYFLRYQYHG